MKSETKITEANIRIAIAYQYSTFEVSMKVENADGIKTEEINDARQQCQNLALHAVDEYKAKPPVDSKKEIDRIERELKQIKAVTSEKPVVKSDDRPEVIAKVEKMPLYKPRQSNSKTPNDINGLGADD